MNNARAHLHILVAAVFVVLIAPAVSTAQPVFSALHAFSAGPDGANSSAALIQAKDGNFYGTTSKGGAFNAGTVFRMTPAGTVTVLHTFGAGMDGLFPQAALIQATDGNFYGTTSQGGGTANAGTVFRMTPAGDVTVLHAFAGGPDGRQPQAALIQATDGNFYGTTTYGGFLSMGLCTAGCGTIFKMTPAGTVTVLHAFVHVNGGAYPLTLIQATDGDFYGTTVGDKLGGSTAFKITPAGTFTVLHVFGGEFVGDSPTAALIQASDGNFYGTTAGILLFPCFGELCGSVFKMTPGGTVTFLHVFTGGADGAYPTASLIQAADGNLYGTTTFGGGPTSSSCPNGCGTAFKITSDGIVTALHAFPGGTDGATPRASLIQATDGNFYGTAYEAGAFGAGIVFRLIVMAARHVDLNGDGRGDVFLYNKATGERRFELANGLPSGFTESSGSWDAGWQVYAVNLNRDQFTDFFLYDPARGLWVQALNHGGDGTFTYTLGNWDRSWTVVPADLDGDGLSDLFVYNFTTGVWVKCFVDGAGGFKGYAVGSSDPGLTFYPADLNGDGRDDFLLYNRVTGAWVEAFSQAGLGTFDYPASGRWDPGWQVTAADLNGDGRADLLLLNAAGVHVTALARAGGGFDYVGGPQWSPGWTVAPGDLNDDGVADLFLYNPVTGVWVEAFSDGTGSFTYTSGQWDPGWSVARTYFNGDGVPDLILSRADGTWVQATVTDPGTFTYTVGNWGPAWTVFARSSSDR